MYSRTMKIALKQQTTPLRLISDGTVWTKTNVEDVYHLVSSRNCFVTYQSYIEYLGQTNK